MKFRNKGAARVISFILVFIMTVSVFTMAGAGKVQAKSVIPDWYSHISISTVVEGNSEWTLAGKPKVEKYLGKVFGKEIWDNIYLNKKQNSKLNGTEYQSKWYESYQFTENSKFRVTAKFTDGKTTTEEMVFIITNVNNYKGSGLTYYEYCRKNYCDSHDGIDMRIPYDEIAKNLKFNAVYDVDGDVKSVTDSADYKIGDEVSVTGAVPAKDGFKFKGWEYDGKIYNAGDKVKMTDGGIKFTAVWDEVIKEYTVTFLNYDGKFITAMKVKEGEAVEPIKARRAGYKSEGDNIEAKWVKYTFDKWVPSGDVKYTVEDMKNAFNKLPEKRKRGRPKKTA